MEKLLNYMMLNPICCSPNTSLKSAAKLMARHKCGILIVVDSEINKKIEGVISDRDLFCRSLARGLNPLELTVEDCMSYPVITINYQDKLTSASETMIQNKLLRIPVVDDDERLCGLFTLGELVEAKEFSAVFPIITRVNFYH